MSTDVASLSDVLSLLDAVTVVAIPGCDFPPAESHVYRPAETPVYILGDGYAPTTIRSPATSEKESREPRMCDGKRKRRAYGP